MKTTQNHPQSPFLFLAKTTLAFTMMLSLFVARPVSAQGSADGGAIWYVSTTAPNDSGSCTAPDAPCLTINGAIAKAADGDTIQVAVGTYTAASGEEVVLINKSITLSGGWDETFTTQSDMSTIDGQGIRKGVYSEIGTIVAINNFTIQNGFSRGIGGGGINIYFSTLTLNNSVISNNVSQGAGGGILNWDGTLTINNSTITNNNAGNEGPLDGGGGIANFYGTVVLNNSTISYNFIPDGYGGSGIYTDGSFILNNSTISGNKGGDAIYVSGGSLVINNDTISKNEFRGISNSDALITIQNTIIADNGTAGDCFNYTSGNLRSQGYNLIGNNTNCVFTAKTGDIVGTNVSPVDPQLGPLKNNGGTTFTHALSRTSPALNAGNPKTPGSGGNACMGTDQRGTTRPKHSTCDIGAFELDLDIPSVVSITRLDPSPTLALSVNFLVTFSEPVTGVDITEPFNDFMLTTTGVTDASITAVSGDNATYTVTINTGSGNGNSTIRLDLLDDDSILDSSGVPLGGTGAGNGNFTSGQKYSLIRIPILNSPINAMIDTSPTYKWTKINGATKYQYQLTKGETVIYTKTVPASVCDVSLCSSTPSTKLDFGNYRWRARALIGGAWKNYSPYKTFVVSPAKPGFWIVQGVDFFVTDTNAKVDNFSISMLINGCGIYYRRIVHNPLVPISFTNKNFRFTGSFYANGTFITPTRAQGSFGLNRYFIPGCGYVSGGPFPWAANWKDSGQPGVLLNQGDAVELIVSPEFSTPFEIFTIDPEK